MALISLRSLLEEPNPKDPQAIYWLGQAILATDGGDPTPAQVQEAKALYQKGLTEVGSDAWLLVGMGHVGILQKEDMNSVKQKFEQAITSTTETKGKNKKKEVITHHFQFDQIKSTTIQTVF